MRVKCLVQKPNSGRIGIQTRNLLSCSLEPLTLTLHYLHQHTHAEAVKHVQYIYMYNQGIWQMLLSKSAYMFTVLINVFIIINQSVNQSLTTIIVIIINIQILYIFIYNIFWTMLRRKLSSSYFNMIKTLL